MNNDLILIGGGGHCKACIDVIEQDKKYNIIGILDKTELLGNKVLGYEIIGDDAQIQNLIKMKCNFLITLGQIRSSSKRQQIFIELEKYNAKIATIISPLSYVSKHAKIELGTIVMHDALINTNANIGKNCIINSKALIEHDVVIEDHCHISTGAIVNGNVLIKAGTFFGSNATSKESVQSTEAAFIKAGSMFVGQ